MRITSFEPMIITPASNMEKVTSVFEALGFACRHRKENTYGNVAADNTVVTMKNGDGFKVDVISSNVIPQDAMAIRMNVSNLDEALELLKGKGFTLVGEGILTDATAKTCLVAAPSGFVIGLIEHLK